MTNPVVLFVDDEPFHARPYVDELAKKYEVLYLEDIVSASAIINSGKPVAAIVLDNMMPSPEEFLDETTNGLDTGLWFLCTTVAIIKNRNIPVIILTHRQFQHVSDEIDKLMCNYALPDGLVSVRPKIETPRFLLPMLVSGKIQRFQSAD